MIWLAIALAKSAAGFLAWLAAWWYGPPPATPLPPGVHALLLSVFAASGLLLVRATARDAAARWLGIAFCLFASIFSDRFLEVLPLESALAGGLRRLLLATIPAALVPAYLWRFAWHFPRVQPALVPVWLPRLVERLAFAAGAALFLLVAVLSVAGGESAAALARDVLWTAVGLLLLPTVVLLVAKARTALPEERRRIRLFIWGLVLGMAPLLIDVLFGSFVPPYRAFVRDNTRAIAMTVATAILIVPVITAYAVVVERVLETRLIVRMAIQYALARYVVLGLAAVPIVVLARYLYRHRQQPLADIVAQAPLSVWLAVLGLALCLERFRRPLLRAIDRRYFREQHDAKVILATLTDSTRGVTSLEQLARLVTEEIDKALHVRGAALLIRRAGRFEDPLGTVPPLAAAATLATLATGSTSALNVDPADSQSPLRRLPPGEAEWIAAAAPRLLLPLVGSEQHAIGLIVLGEKRSETPYTAQDRMLLQAVATSAVLALEQLLRATTPSARPVRSAGTLAADSTPAQQCDRCGRVFEPEETTCDVCALRLSVAPVPICLAGKIRVLCRIGSGGMGIVYKGEDIDLGRLVAIKTLPLLSDAAGRRLRREARALAALHHPHLETIHGVESWQGVPMLVLEFLAGGTLAARLERGAVALESVLATGLAMADALHGLHRVGVLHRDVKPSNIGYTADGTPKLLDFGLAVAAEPERSGLGGGGQSTTRTVAFGAAPANLTSTVVAGTPLYMSPEALAGAAPEVSFDLWGLGVTLYEAVAGRNPFVAPDRLETARLISSGTVPDIRSFRADCPPALSAFLTAALSHDPARRPRSAREFGHRLRAAAVSDFLPESLVSPTGQPGESD